MEQPIISNNVFDIKTYPHAELFRFESNNIEIRFVGFYNKEMEKRAVFLDYRLQELSREAVPQWDKRESMTLNYYPGSKGSNIPKNTPVVVAKVTQVRYKSTGTLEDFYNCVEFPDLKPSFNLRLEYRAECEDYELSLFEGQVYVISDHDGRVVDYIIDKSCRLQSGDNGTMVYIVDDDRILIWNTGDVMSVITMSLKKRDI